MLSNRFASQVTEIDADNRREPITAGEGGLVTTVRPAPSTSHTFTSDPENKVSFDLVLLAFNCKTFTPFQRRWNVSRKRPFHRNCSRG